MGPRAEFQENSTLTRPLVFCSSSLAHSCTAIASGAVEVSKLAYNSLIGAAAAGDDAGGAAGDEAGGGATGDDAGGGATGDDAGGAEVVGEEEGPQPLKMRPATRMRITGMSNNFFMIYYSL